MMSNEWIGAVAVCLAIGACATKPKQADFEQKTNEFFSQARSSAISDGSVLNWLGLAVADNIRSGKYEDYMIAAKYTVTIGDKPAIECFGIFGNISCGNPNSK